MAVHDTTPDLCRRYDNFCPQGITQYRWETFVLPLMIAGGFSRYRVLNPYRSDSTRQERTNGIYIFFQRPPAAGAGN